MTPTVEQAEIIDFAKRSSQSLLINALAGAAKTSTLVMIAHAVPPQPILCLAFNKRIAEEMQKRMPGHVSCLTLNSAGHRAWAKVIGTRLVLDTSKTYTLLREAIEGLKGTDKSEARELWGSIQRGVGVAKSIGWVPKSYRGIAESLVSDEELESALGNACDDDVGFLGMSLIEQVMEHSIKLGYAGNVDFDDQIYLSTLFGKSFPKFALLMVDEAQDLSPLNHLMVERMRPSRLIAVGDPWQSIYAFRGADRFSMQKLKTNFDMAERTLSVSFRCSRKGVERARFRVPHFKHTEEAIDGEIIRFETWNTSDIPEGTAILCRNNAPLFSCALSFIKSGRGVQIIGRDVGPGLIKVLKKLGPPDLARDRVFITIDAWKAEALAKAKSDRHGSIIDRAECLRVFAEAGETLDQAISYAEHLFSADGTVKLMTIHKAKGLEFDDIVHLDPWRIPSKYARIAADSGDDGPMDQELNLRYVCETRWKKRMMLADLEKLNGKC